MTISLEEHVARAIWKARHSLKPYDVGSAKQRDDVGHEARAAIAAAREYEAACYAEFEAVLDNPPEPNEALKALMRRGRSIRDMEPPASIRESERAACESIADGKADEWEEEDGNYKAGRYHACIEIRDAIAARKGKGEGK